MLSSSCELSGHLFDSVPAFLPDLEDNETLFSWAGRYHRRSGNARIQETSRALFGDSAAGLHHDFPSHVTHLAKCFGTANIGEQLVFKHTIFGAIAKFLDRKTVLSSLSMMLGPSVTGLKQKIGLLKGGVGAANPLKACWECIAADTQTSSGPIWHLEHQWPSVLVCRKHWLPLTVLKDREQVKVRMVEIDAPEKGQAFGNRSKQALSQLVHGRQVEIREQGIDRYDRTLGRVYLSGLDVNTEMVRRGMAWVYIKYTKDKGLYQLEAEAREQRRGLWADKEPVPPWEWRRDRKTE